MPRPRRRLRRQLQIREIPKIPIPPRPDALPRAPMRALRNPARIRGIILQLPVCIGKLLAREIRDDPEKADFIVVVTQQEGLLRELPRCALGCVVREDHGIVDGGLETPCDAGGVGGPCDGGHDGEFGLALHAS